MTTFSRQIFPHFFHFNLRVVADCCRFIRIYPRLLPSTSKRMAFEVIHASRQREGGGFIVQRSIGSRQLSELDPFLLLDHMGPSTYAPGKAVGAPSHPHRGFQTVTYMIKGVMEHKDSKGNKGTLRDGWMQWMTAGSGIIHSELPGDDLMKNGGDMEGFQLWVNLPADKKMMSPSYQDTPPDMIPDCLISSGCHKDKVKVLAGNFSNINSQINTQVPVNYFDVQLCCPNAIFSWSPPTGHNAMVYCWNGSADINLNGSDLKLHSYDYIPFNGGNNIKIKCQATSKARCLVLSGEPLGEPISRHGPFVMNTKEQIKQAIDDYQSGNFVK